MQTTTELLTGIQRGAQAAATASGAPCRRGGEGAGDESM